MSTQWALLKVTDKQIIIHVLYINSYFALLTFYANLLYRYQGGYSASCEKRWGCHLDYRIYSWLWCRFVRFLTQILFYFSLYFLVYIDDFLLLTFFLLLLYLLQKIAILQPIVPPNMPLLVGQDPWIFCLKLQIFVSTQS